MLSSVSSVDREQGLDVSSDFFFFFPEHFQVKSLPNRDQMIYINLF